MSAFLPFLQRFFAMLTTSSNVGEDTILPLELHASIFGRLVSPTMLIDCGRIWNPPLQLYLLTFTTVDTIRNYTTKQKAPRFGCFFFCDQCNLGIRGAFFCQQNLFFAHTWCVFVQNITSSEYRFAIFIAMVQYYKNWRGGVSPPDISTKQIFF